MLAISFEMQIILVWDPQSLGSGSLLSLLVSPEMIRAKENNLGQYFLKKFLSSIRIMKTSTFGIVDVN